ncbi:helix-turn-helix domain-containing protein [Nocardia terpenica]|uniref:helix-turn-helix domain-containing protein n=1 Tax=Nocardia terpenica TaxID=455432 RepID=UPI001E324F69|nr:helix-turn-helix domain-containing protein [Nocardia terpenica]
MTGPEYHSGARAMGKPMRAWPVLLLALPAFVAIWSGWVGLGELTGFGPVRPLPGIWDRLTVNTAITLPIGMETYASYALYVWLGNRIRSAGTRRYAKYSAFGSLALGAVGQIAYHLMQAAGVGSAPWPVTVLVACLPVAVLGMGAALAHMILREHHTLEQSPVAVHGGAHTLGEDHDTAADDQTRAADAPPSAPGQDTTAPGGAPTPRTAVSAPPRASKVVRAHRPVPRTHRRPHRSSPVRTLRPRTEQAHGSGIVPDQPTTPAVAVPAAPGGEPVAPTDRDALIQELNARGMSARQIGPLVGVHHTTVLRVLGRAEGAPADAPPARPTADEVPAAQLPVHTTTPSRHHGLRVVAADTAAQEPDPVIDAELVDDTGQLALTEHHIQSQSGTAEGGA